MSGFDRNEFWKKILSLYPAAVNSNYIVRLNEEQIREFKALYIETYIPMEKLGHYNDEQIMKKMMTAMASVYKLDKDTVTNYGEVVELVNTVNYDGKYMYVHFGKISRIKMRRFEIGKSQKQIAEKTGYTISTIQNCEEYYCDMSRQPENLVYKLAKALECDVDDIL